MDIEKMYDQEIDKMNEETTEWFTIIDTEYLAAYSRKDSKTGAEIASKLLRSCQFCSTIYTLLQTPQGNCPSCGKELVPTRVEYTEHVAPQSVPDSAIIEVEILQSQQLNQQSHQTSTKNPQGVASSLIGKVTAGANAVLNDICPKCGKAIPEYLKEKGVCPYCKTKDAAGKALKILKRI